MKLKLCFVFCLMSVGNAFAAGGSGSPKDLLWPFFNVTVLAALLLYKLIPVMKKHFGEKAKTIAEVMERASVRAKEAQMLMDVQKKKLDSLDDEITNLKKEGDDEVSSYKDTYTKEVDERIVKLKSDAAKKIETEKQEMANDLNEELLNAVIANAKVKIKGDNALSASATNKILEGLN